MERGVPAGLTAEQTIMVKAGKADKKELIKFGNTGCIFFGVIGLLLFLKFRLELKTYIFFGLSAFFLICPRVSLPVMQVVFKVMTAVAGVIGYVNRQILLSIVFFVLFMPVSLIMKIVGKDPMNRRLDPKASTYWIPKDNSKQLDPLRYEQRF